MSKLMIPLSDAKVKAALGPDAKILKYSELKGYESIDDLLPNINDFVINLLEDRENSGHWTCLSKLPDGSYYYFNSYGQKYDTDMSVIPMCIRKILGEDKREITRLLEGRPCGYNKLKLQGATSQCCGRWVVLFLTMTTKMGYSSEEFFQFVKEKSVLFKNYDDLVTKFVNI
jgi:hypothetical protein